MAKSHRTQARDETELMCHDQWEQGIQGLSGVSVATATTIIICCLMKCRDKCFSNHVKTRMFWVSVRDSHECSHFLLLHSGDCLVLLSGDNISDRASCVLLRDNFVTDTANSQTQQTMITAVKGTLDFLQWGLNLWPYGYWTISTQMTLCENWIFMHSKKRKQSFHLLSLMFIVSRMNN